MAIEGTRPHRADAPRDGLDEESRRWLQDLAGDGHASE
ncbi:MAG: hypothetical protein QOG42_469, partial [Solirubrobacteraceae bacterium]|nr:hypothetical protein [Solirubrobacteraceae bacterium]